MSEDAESKSHAGRWVIAVVGALVLYGLSWGPVLVFAMKYDLSDPVNEKIKAFYKPLFIGCKRLGVAESMLRYGYWWGHVCHVPVNPFWPD